MSSLWRRVYEERKRVALPLLVVLAVNAAVFVLAVLPFGRNVAAAEVDRGAARAALAQAERQHAEIKEVRASRERADQELRRFYTDVLPRDHATATKASNVWLQGAAKADGLKFSNQHNAQADVRESRLSRVSSTVTLFGLYPNIRRFLHAVETAEEFIIIESVTLSQSEQSQLGAGASLTVELGASTYYPTEAIQ